MNIKLSDLEIRELKKLLANLDSNNVKDIDSNILKHLFLRLSQKDRVELYVDGAANLQNEKAGIGGVIYKNGQEIYSFSEYIGKGTNNEAEYTALIKGLKELINLNILSIDIYADSELVVKQVNGEYKVKNDRMQKLHHEVMSLLNKFNLWNLTHIPREHNTVADKLSKEGMRNTK